MAIELPKNRLNVRQVQAQARKIPLEQIIAIQGQSPVATGIETLGNTIGQTLQKRAELQRQGQELAKLESISGQPAGAFTGLSPDIAQSLATKFVTEKANAYTPEQLKSLYAGDPTGMSAAFPQGVPKEAASLAGTVSSRDANREALKVERDTKREQQINKDILQYSEALEKNPIARKVREQGIGLDQMNQLAELTASGNTVASSAMGTKAARAMGEVGVLTETDIKRYVQSGRLDRAAADTLSKWVQGRPTEATINEIKQIGSVLNDSFKEKIQPIHNTYIERLSRNYGLKPEEAAYRLAVDYVPGVKSKLSPIEPRRPQTITPKKVGRFQVEVE